MRFTASSHPAWANQPTVPGQIEANALHWPDRRRRDDNRYFAAAGLTYKMNREMQLKGELRHDWLTSTQAGNAYQATSVLLTLRLQR